MASRIFFVPLTNFSSICARPRSMIDVTSAAVTASFTPVFAFFTSWRCSVGRGISVTLKPPELVPPEKILNRLTGHYARCHGIGPLLIAVTDLADVIRELHSRVLLHDMCQLVRDQLSSFVRMRRELPRSKHDVATDRVSKRADGARRLGGAVVRVNAHVAEIMIESRFH